MWFICDQCDIYVTALVCTDEMKKQKKYIFRSLCRVPPLWHSAKLVENLKYGRFAERLAPGTRQSWVEIANFPALPSASRQALGKAI
jgi:hypothetical protein